MKIKHKNREDVAVTIDGTRYKAVNGVLDVSDDVAARILKEFPDWGEANPTKKKRKVKEDG